MKKLFVFVISIIMLFSLCSCGNENDNLKTEQLEDNSFSEKINDESNDEKIYKYNAYGLQNVVDIYDVWYYEELGYYEAVYVTVRCPACGKTFDAMSRPMIIEKEFGQQIIIWDGREACNFPNCRQGYFDIAVQFVRTEEYY